MPTGRPSKDGVSIEEAARILPFGAGPLAAVLLGLALVPLRDAASASNLSFAFMALTIVTAEFGGRAAALATAFTSALSLDYFLTEPYFRLSIEEHEDVIAFIGLAVCGLIAAGLGSSRGERIAALTATRTHRDLLRLILSDWEQGAAGGPQLAGILRACLDAFPLAGAVLRDEANRLVACAGPADERRDVPAEVLEPTSLWPASAPGSVPRGWSPPLPALGGRIVLAGGQATLGWLDVWGNGRSSDTESRQALWDVARLLALLLAARSLEPVAAPYGEGG
jgi:Domain of unknown function (DUF4118)